MSRSKNGHTSLRGAVAMLTVFALAGCSGLESEKHEHEGLVYFQCPGESGPGDTAEIQYAVGNRDVVVACRTERGVSVSPEVSSDPFLPDMRTNHQIGVIAMTVLCPVDTAETVGLNQGHYVVDVRVADGCHIEKVVVSAEVPTMETPSLLNPASTDSALWGLAS